MCYGVVSISPRGVPGPSRDSPAAAPRRRKAASSVSWTSSRPSLIAAGYLQLLYGYVRYPFSFETLKLIRRIPGPKIQKSTVNRKVRSQKKTGDDVTRQSHDPRFNNGLNRQKQGRLGWDSEVRSTGPALSAVAGPPMRLLPSPIHTGTAFTRHQERPECLLAKRSGDRATGSLPTVG